MCGENECHYGVFKNFNENLERIQSELVECNYEIGILSTEFLVFIVDNDLYREPIRKLLKFCFLSSITPIFDD